MNNIYFSLDKHSRIILLKLDLSSAFDSIYHDILINRLKIEPIWLRFIIIFHVRIFHYMGFHRDPN